jgi:hypothetical protein
LQETQVTDNGLQYVGQLKGLRILLLGSIAGNSAISDAGLAHLNGLMSLQHLGLRYAPIEGAGLSHLAGLSKLESLSLEGTRIDDRSLSHLSRLTSLVELDVRNTRVTPEGVASLQESLPNCIIKFDQAKGDSLFGP